MSVERTETDSAIVPAPPEPPGRFWPERTPTVGATPVLPDSEAADLAKTALEEVAKESTRARAAPRAARRSK